MVQHPTRELLSQYRAAVYARTSIALLRIEMRHHHPDLLIGHFTTEVLEDRLEVGAADILHRLGDRAVGPLVDPGVDPLWTARRDELGEIAPRRTESAAGCRRDLFDAGPLRKQFEGRLFRVVQPPNALATRTAADGGVQG